MVTGDVGLYGGLPVYDDLGDQAYLSRRLLEEDGVSNGTMIPTDIAEDSEVYTPYVVILAGVVGTMCVGRCLFKCYCERPADEVDFCRVCRLLWF